MYNKYDGIVSLQHRLSGEFNSHNVLDTPDIQVPPVTPSSCSEKYPDVRMIDSTLEPREVEPRLSAGPGRFPASQIPQLV